MIPRTRRRIGIAAASGALLLMQGTAAAGDPVTSPSPPAATPTPAAGEPSPAPSPSEYSLYAPNVVTLTFTIGESPEPVQRAVSLSCDPTAGTHPDPADACRVLAAARGDVASIPAANGLCTFEYAPVTVTLRGVWGGSLRSYTGTFTNRCILVDRTEGLFDF